MVTHTLQQIYNTKSKILILGSFPSVKSRETGFYYGHPQNRFWKVLSAVLRVNTPVTTKEKTNMLLSHGIALWDVIASCDITGSSDSSIANVTANDLEPLILASNISVIYCNGHKAFTLYEKYIKPALSKKKIINPNAIELPSTSPANAAWSLDALINSWNRILSGLRRSNFHAHYYSLNDYSTDYYNKKLYRLSLDGGFSCPNRDGTIGYGGCIFCSNEGSGDFSGSRNISITKQLEDQKALIARKLPKTKPVGYIAYFQAYTGTYDNISRLKTLYYEAINDSSVDILSIATRPDCLSDDVLQLLAKLNKVKPVWIELGLQTIHPKTAQYIRRGYELKVYNQAVTNLRKIGISQIITHVILGLPSETPAMMKKTIDHVCKCGSNGIKLQLLHVLQGTDLALDYEKGGFGIMSLDEYKMLLGDICTMLPPDMVVHRFTGDGNKKTLIAPLWSGDKKNVLNTVNSYLATLDSFYN